MTTKKDSFQTDGGAGQLQEQVDQDNEQGYRGTTPDDTPPEAYTATGAKSLKAPEADEDLDAQGNATDSAKGDK